MTWAMTVTCKYYTNTCAYQSNAASQDDQTGNITGELLIRVAPSLQARCLSLCKVVDGIARIPTALGGS